MREAFEAKVRGGSPEQEKLETSYTEALAELLEEAKAEGNLELALAVEAEAKRFEETKNGVGEPSPHPRIAKLQNIFSEQAARIARQWNLDLVILMREYGKQLEELKIEFTKAGELQSAVAVQRERERIGRMIAAGGAPIGAKTVPSQLPDPDGQPADMRQKVKVFVLMGQENMAGSGSVSGRDSKSLETATKEGRYPYLVDANGAWTVRKDVRNVFVNNFNDKKNDWLTAKDTEKIGPEIGFGSVIGEAFDAPVMLIKTCNGNRSLGWDLLPPGSKQYEYRKRIYAGYKDTPSSWPMGSRPKAIDWYGGKQYDDDVGSAKKVLKDLDKYYPGAFQYEIAGFVFWQGERDRKESAHASRYEQNLVQLIKQLRKDFDAPNAKFVCATLGQTKKGDGGNEGTILAAQLAVDGNTGKYKEFKGNVATVYTNPLSHGGSSSNGYERNASTFMDVGVALGRAMVELFAE